METMRSARPIDLIKPMEQRYGWDCGPCALSIAYKALGKNIDEGHIATQMEVDPEEGTAWAQMVLNPFVNGFTASFKERSNYDELQERVNKGDPIIVGWVSDRTSTRYNTEQEGHYSVVKAQTPRHIMLADPSFGNLYTMSREQFEQVWWDEETKHAFMVVSHL